MKTIVNNTSKGEDKTRWYYEDEEISLVYETLTHYFENEPEVFETIKRKKSENKLFKKREQTVKMPL